MTLPCFSRGSRLFLRMPSFPWSFLVSDDNFPDVHATELNPVSNRDILLPATGSPTSLLAVNLESSFFISGDGFQTAHLVEVLYRNMAHCTVSIVLGVTTKGVKTCSTAPRHGIVSKRFAVTSLSSR